MLKSLTKLQENKRGANGITLVALVVTIVVLLILAGITIASLTGDNGILGKVGEAKEQTDLAQIREEVILLWNETQIEVAGKGYTNDQIADIFEEKLKEKDPDATVKYQPSNDTYEVDYKDHMFEVQISGELTNNREDVVNDIEDAFDNIDKDLAGEDKADQIQDELNKKDPDSTAEYDPDTGNTDINHGGYEAEVDEDGNITIIGPEQDKNINIISQPESVEATEGDRVTFEVEATGAGELSYQWYKSTTNLATNGTEIDGENGSTYTIDAVKIDDNNTYYYCIVTQNYEGSTTSVTSNVAKLTVEREIVINPPSVSTQPSDVGVIEGITDVTFKVEVEGEGTLTYQWYKNTTNSNEGGTPIDGEIGNTYTIPKEEVTTDLNGTYYYVEVTQNYEGDIQTTKSEVALLSVEAKAEITVNPQPVTAFEKDQDVTFEVKVTGEGDFTYQWYKNTTNSNQNGTPIDGEISNTYTIPKEEVTTDLSGTYYYVVVTQNYGSSTVTKTSEAAMLTVEKTPVLTITKQPEAVETISGIEDVSFSVIATGVDSGSASEETISYQWYYNMTNSNQNGTPIQNAQSSTYKISKDAVTAGISGRYYYCVVTQEYKGKTNTATTNTAQLTVISPVEVTSQPTSMQAIEGANDVTFTVAASGNGDISYQWYYKTSQEGAENAILGANSSSYTIDAEDVTTDLNGRYYFAKVNQSYGTAVATATSNEALLTVAEKASITSQPSSITVTEGSKATFEVIATGIGDLSYQWYRNTSNSTTGGTPIDKATNNSYTINNATAEDNDTYYYVVITQKYGSSTAQVTSSAARLTVGNGASVSTPNDVNVIAGVTDVTFEVEASGSGTFSYQWYKNTTDSNQNGTPIDGEVSNTYTIPKEEVTTDLDGSYYYVEVTQNYGGTNNKVTSEAAALSVKAETEITVNPSPVTAYENGQNVIFSVTATGEGNITYQWYKNTTNSNQNGTPIDNATGSTYTIPKEEVTTDLNGTYYYVVVTQRYGSCIVTKTSQVAMLTVLGTSIDASETDVTVYVNGSSKTVTLSGTNAGTFSIETPANSSYAIAEISEENNNQLIITPVAAGETSVEVAEGNGGKTVTINIHVLGTTITAEPQSVTAYVGGASQKVTLGGENSGAFSVETQPEALIATASVSGNILTITPVGEGNTSVVVKETNGNKTTSVSIEVRRTSIDANNKDITLYVGGSSQEIQITGTQMGELSIEQGLNTAYATASLGDNNTLTISPVTEGETSVTVKEGNGNKTVTINIHVLGTTIQASPESVIAYVDGSDQQVTISGQHMGTVDITGEPEAGIATASIGENNVLTIHPVGEGRTSVVVTEENGNRTATVDIEVRETSITATTQSVTAYVGGADQTVTISGQYIGELRVDENTNPEYATASLEGTTLTIHPLAAGDTRVTVRELNGNKTVTITVHVVQSDMTVTNSNVTAYVGGASQEVTIEGTDLGTLSISKQPEEGIATADLQGNKLTISPVGDGKTSVEVTESNGNNTVTVNITVLTPSITSQTVEVYAGGLSKQVEITGQYMGSLTIAEEPDSTYATASIDGTTLTVTPSSTAGNTSLLLRESNGGQTARININVTATSIDANNKDVILYVGGSSEQVTISGENAGDFEIQTEPDSAIATASLSDDILTISPVGAGPTSIVVKENNGNKTVTINVTVEATTIIAQPSSVIAYVGGNNQTVTLSGDSAGTFSVLTPADGVHATAQINPDNNNELIITPISEGTTRVVVQEANGKQTTEVSIEVRETNITTTTLDVTLYVGGNEQEVEITGTYMGTLNITKNPDGGIATAELNGSILTIHPEGKGNTSVEITEANGNKTVTINIHVIESDITVDNPNVTAYVGGSDQVVTISGDSIGNLSITGNPTETVATATLSGNTLTIHPVGNGQTSVTVTEDNGYKAVTVNITVHQTSINTQTVEVYAGGTSKQVEITGQYMGALTISEQPDSRYATAEISGTTLAVTPTQTAGSTYLTLREANGGQTARIDITVIGTSIDADNKNVGLYVGGASSQVHLSGTNAGTFEIETTPQETVATASISGSTLTISPVGAGDTTVVVKENNGNKTVTINVNVQSTTITASPESVVVYVDGSNQTVTLGGKNAGTFSVLTQPDGSKATAEINPSNNKELIITPKGAGSTSVLVKEENGNKTIEIPIEVRQTSIGATTTNVTAYVGGSDQTVTITGTYLGELRIDGNTNPQYATASLGDNNTLTIQPLVAGDTSITVRELNGNKTVTIIVHVIQSNITASDTNVTAYVGGIDQTVTIEGTDLGNLSISSEPDDTVATAELVDNTLTIKPVGDGSTTVEVTESNGNSKVTINVTVLATSITAQNIEVYAGGASKQVTIEGLNMGTLTIEDGPDETYATASIDGTTLTVTPVKAGNTSLVLTESNGNQEATININVIATSIDANNKDVTVYVGGNSQQVQITGTEMGTLSVEPGINEAIATADLSGNTLTITPKGEGQTSVTVKEANGNKTVTINIDVKTTSIDANNKDVTLYVGGSSQQVQITGTEMGDLSISGEPNPTYATAELNENTLTINPVGAGSTSVTVKEANGNQTVTINITVKATSIDATNKDVTLYVGGSSQEVTITGTEMGTLATSGIDTGIATAELSETTLTITPVGEGETSVTVTEGNGQQKVTINITVKETEIKADNEDVTVYVGGANPQVHITGTNAGALSIETPADGIHARAELSNGIVTITGLAQGDTSVTIKEGNGNKTVTINIHVLETSIEATNTNVTAYVDGNEQIVTINGNNMGTLSMQGPDEKVATAQLNGRTLTILPVAEGTTSITITEGNTNKSVTINIEVKETSIDANNKNVTVYVDGNPQTVEITGDNLGTLSAITEPQGVVETSIEDNILTITPVGEGTATITVKEANGGQTVEISVEVKTVTISPVTGSVTLYVGGNAQTVGVTGTNYGTLSVVTPPTSTVATAEVASDNKGIIITPVGAGNTSVTVREANANKEFTINIEVIQSTITAEPTSVTAYVGGADKTVQIDGTSLGSLSITDEPESSIAEAILQGNTLTIKPVGAGDTSVEVTENNGNQKVTVDIHVQATSITPQTVEVYAGGTAKTVTIQGLNMGALEISTPPDGTYATASINGTSLTITPTQTAGNTSLILTEANGGKTATIPINVLATSVEANPSSITANVSDGPQTVTLDGTNAGTFEIVTQPEAEVATAQLSESTLTITPVGGGTTSVVVKETNGNKQVTISITISALVTAGDVPTTDYGTKVNGYEYPNEASGIEWQLFYADDNNIYLIADDYIPYEYVPSNSAGHKPSRDPSYQRSVSIDSDLFNDYLGSDSITDEKLKALNNDFFNVKKYKSTYDNMKITAYMLDTDAWSVYAGDKAEYAIGGATVELFLKSYNKKYGTNYKAQATKPYYRENIGYQLSKNGGTSWDYGLSIKINDSTYAISSTTNALCALLASPSAYENYHEIGAFTGGLDAVIASDVFGTGLRPIVCLKSDVHLQKNSDGSYTIVELPKNNNIESSDYGAKVKGYDCENNDGVTGWKIFYADYDNTYLISEDYIPYEYIPSNSKGHKPNNGSTKYQAYFTNILNDYTGSANITDERLKSLNNDYLNVKKYTSTNANMKAVAYMLDINAWSVYAGNCAEYAIGGPTVEMLLKSYSEKYMVDYRAQADSNTGYKMSNDGGSSWQYYYNDMLSTSDSTYVINSTTKASSMWLASPSTYSTNDIMHVNNAAGVGRNVSNGKTDGFRPIVCLKSDTKLVKNSDGSYTIVDDSDIRTELIKRDQCRRFRAENPRLRIRKNEQDF